MAVSGTERLARTERWMKWVIYFVGAALLTAAVSAATAEAQVARLANARGFADTRL